MSIFFTGIHIISGPELTDIWQSQAEVEVSMRDIWHPFSWDPRKQLMIVFCVKQEDVKLMDNLAAIIPIQDSHF